MSTPTGVSDASAPRPGAARPLVGDGGGTAATAAPLAAAPPELDRPFRMITFDWDGTAVASRSADATRPARLIDALLGRGARIAVVTGTSLVHVLRQLGDHVRRENARRLLVCTNRGSEVFGFDRRGAPIVLWTRVASEEEERRLDAIAEEVRARIERVTRLPIRIVYDRVNRRKIDLIPEPAWVDPPKSAIGELLAATEARLRGAGLRHGLREAFELTERIAREMGVPDARVTSDVKHIEVGLTDKADAMTYLFREIASPLCIEPRDVLIVGDEFGPIAGFEGSDHRMLAVPEVTGAVVVSVGPEPGGAPEAVLHLGGGPERFCALLEHQLGVEERLGPFAPERDAAWAIEEPGFDVAREHEIESLLAIANGFVGSRASIAEGSSVSRPATFLAGAFEPSSDISPVPELVVLPDWGRLRFLIEGELFSVESGEMVEHRRVLDLRRGLLLREGLGSSPSGRMTQLRTIHIASLAHRHVLLEGVELTPQNYSGSIRIEALLSGDVTSASGACHWARIDAETNAGPTLVGVTHGGLTAALHSRLELDRADPTHVARWEAATGSTWAAESCELPVRIGERRDFFRTVLIYTSRETPAPRAAADADSERIVGVPDGSGAREVLREHECAWEERWRRGDVEIDGAPRLERALRFALYHLIASANPEDAGASIGARALAGEAYRGHVFWDTEIFMLPFFIHGFPEAARALLGYRYRTLGGARRKAKRLGYEGALYAWESAETGDETTPEYVLSASGQILRVLSGVEEQHISADVAYAVGQYLEASGDLDFGRCVALEILLETARFWASRVQLDAAGLGHIRGVIGPDEYHEGIDDNAFTNWMARHNLLLAADTAELPWAGDDARRLGISAEELARFRDIADRIVLGRDPATGLIEQFAGFFGLEEIDLAAYTPRSLPMDVLLGRARTQASKVIKQADVVQLIALLWDDFSPAERLANFAYYEPKTSHGSSLSPGTPGWGGARRGGWPRAARYFPHPAAIAAATAAAPGAGGGPAAGLGSLWQAVVLGAGGVRPARTPDHGLTIEPNLLPGWRHLGFPFHWRGRWLRIDVEPALLEVSFEGDGPLTVRAGGHERRLEPGRRYAAARKADGSAPLEEAR